MGTNQDLIHPVKADASQGLPFPHEFFDAVVSIDSYNYFGRDPQYLSEKLLPYVKKGGTLHLAFPGATKNFHDNIPECLLKSWTPEQLDYMQDLAWWKEMISKTDGIEILEMKEMDCTKDAWADWLACENEYAQSDRAAIEAGGLCYLNTISVTLRKN
ncbi:MAG: methyltransferase domain-containing protein [Anaerotardibacter sp.]